MTTARDTLIAAGVLAALTLIVAAASFVFCAVPVLLADWLLSTGIPAASAWIDADPVRGPALGLGTIALFALWLTKE